MAVVAGSIVATLASASPAQATGAPASDLRCEGRSCIGYDGDHIGYRATAWGAGFYGHIDLWGPQISFRHSVVMQDPYISADGSQSGLLCSHGWKHENGNYLDMGNPCIPVP